MPSLHEWKKLHMNYATLQEKQHNKEQYLETDYKEQHTMLL